MQKKVKSKLTDVLFVLVCLSGASYNFYRFWQSWNKAQTKNEKPIATITFKYKTAQRKFLDDLIWDRLRQESPVYEGDTIRTAPLSEATIYFNDGNIMDLQENTMARLSLKSDGLEVDFEGGQIALKTNSQASNVKLKTGNSFVDVQAGSSVALNNQNGENFSVQVQNGNATLINESGEVALEEGKTTQFTETGSVTKASLSVTIPTTNQKFMNFTTEKYNVPFSWQADGQTVSIQISQEKDFETITYATVLSNTSQTEVPLDSGTYYWRVSTEDETLSGKFIIVYCPPPSIISPKLTTSIIYRRKTPSIHFAWTEVERATSYELNISKSADMSNPIITQRSSTTSSNINTLEEGTYYFTVTPFYMINNIGLAQPSQVQEFKVSRTAQLSSPSLLIPQANGLVSTQIPIQGQEATYKPVNFSWKIDEEAESYTINIWPEGNSNSIALSETIHSNYYTLDTAKTTINNGMWNWQVTITDNEGNTAKSQVRSFYAIDTEIEQKTLFPPDNYRVAQTRSQDLKYNWKTNIPYNSIVQVARDKNFNDVVFSETTTNKSINGRTLQVGTYYWRIYSDIGGMRIASTPKTLVVEGTIPAPEATFPVKYQKTVIRENVPLTFKWKAVEGIDYYQIKIYETAKPGTVVAEKNFIEPVNGEVTADFDFWDYPETTYHWSIQGFREETILASRAASYLAINNFVMKKLRPVTLTSPKNDTFLDGASAVKAPIDMEWSSVDDTKNVKLVIYSDDVPESSSKWKYDNAPRKMKMPVLYEGNYFWKVYATTLDDYDITSKVTGRFSVGSIPKLAAPKMVEPATSKVFDVNYFVNSKEIKFAWNKVSGADHYLLTVRDKKDNSVLVQESFGANTTEYVLNDLTKLRKGNFQWTVEAQSYYQGTLFQHGEVTPAQFEINLPEIKKTKAKETGKPRYGTEAKKK